MIFCPNMVESSGDWRTILKNDQRSIFHRARRELRPKSALRSLRGLIKRFGRDECPAFISTGLASVDGMEGLPASI